MVRKIYSPFSTYMRVVFELPASLWAARIVVVGDFDRACDHGQPCPIPFVQDRDGTWRVMLDLPTGQQYHFHYLVDGEWRTDFYADGSILIDGSLDSVIDSRKRDKEIKRQGD